jgi:hypothetical protein
VTFLTFSERNGAIRCLTNKVSGVFSNRFALSTSDHCMYISGATFNNYLLITVKRTTKVDHNAKHQSFYYSARSDGKKYAHVRQ